MVATALREVQVGDGKLVGKVEVSYATRASRFQLSLSAGCSRGTGVSLLDLASMGSLSAVEAGMTQPNIISVAVNLINHHPIAAQISPCEEPPTFRHDF